MQVLWLDPVTKEAKGTLRLSEEVHRAGSVERIKNNIAARLAVDANGRKTLKLYGEPLPSGEIASYLPCFQSNSPRFVFTYDLLSRFSGSVFVCVPGKGTLVVDTTPNMLVDEVAQVVQDKTNIPRVDLTVLWGGRSLQGHRSLKAYGIVDDATLNASFRLLGGSILPTCLFADVSDGTNLELRLSSPIGPKWRLEC
ncbi:hypothetical protein AC1031_019565 [Aphanomyces cochlioides]|nr:hypothetical protein AC1031_019565 [Aphanomyces cochlioides]